MQIKGKEVFQTCFIIQVRLASELYLSSRKAIHVFYKEQGRLALCELFRCYYVQERPNSMFMG